MPRRADDAPDAVPDAARHAGRDAAPALHRRGFLRLGALSLAAGVAGSACTRLAGAAAPAARPRPTPAQLRWHRDERAMFVHFGMNTFTDREWGDGTESPARFAPTALDARGWARAARSGGFRALVLTAKHHDGFCLWPTRTTRHSVAASPFRGGAGDVVREFVDACRAEGLRAGLYLSPWDRNHPTYGTGAPYDAVYLAQLTELLTGYGPLAEVWFDGANGEGPDGHRQAYDWPRIFGHVRRLQPDAVIFSDAGPDVRWCGNERGTAGDPNWATVDPARVPAPGATGPGVEAALQHGDPHGTAWRPAEVDVSIRPGWFHHAAEDGRVRTVDDLVQLHFTSVGRNAKLLLNVPPTRDGVLHPTDVARLAGMRDALDALFAHDLAARPAERAWRAGPPRTATLTVDLGRAADVHVVRLAEDVARGQRVAAHRLDGAGDDGAWRPLARGTTIGHARLHRVAGHAVRRLRLTIEDAVEPPLPVALAAY